MDKDACVLHAPYERLLSLPIDHIGICQFDKHDDGDGNGKKQITDFVKVVLQDAEKAIASRMEASTLCF